MWRAGAVLPGDPRATWAAGFPSGLSLLFSPHGLTPSVSTATIPHLRHTHTRTMPAEVGRGVRQGFPSGPPGSTGCMAGPSFWWSFIPPPPPAAVAHAQGYVRDSTSFPPNRSLTISTSSARIAVLRCSRLPPACPTAWAGKSHWVVLAAGCCAAPTHRQSGYCPGPETVNSSRLDSALPYPVQTTPGSLRLR